jgi:hypothetical protein
LRDGAHDIAAQASAAWEAAVCWDDEYSPPSRSSDDEATVRRRVDALNVEIAKVNATVVEGPPTRLGMLDVDQVVGRWRRTRSG